MMPAAIRQIGINLSTGEAMRKADVILALWLLYIGFASASEGAISNGKQSANMAPLLVVFDDSYPPYSWDDKGTKKGFYVELSKVLFERAGYPVQLALYPWKRAIRMVDSKNAILAGIYKTPEREKQYSFTQAWFEERVLLYVPTSLPFEFNELFDLRGKKVGINLGWVISSEFQKARKDKLFTVEESATSEENMRKLMRERIDCFIVDELNGDLLVKQLNAKDKLSRLNTPVAVNKSYLMISKNNPHNANNRLTKKLDAVIDEMKADGSLRDIFNTYMNNTN